MTQSLNFKDVFHQVQTTVTEQGIAMFRSIAKDKRQVCQLVESDPVRAACFLRGLVEQNEKQLVADMLCASGVTYKLAQSGMGGAVIDALRRPWLLDDEDKGEILGMPYAVSGLAENGLASLVVDIISPLDNKWKHHIFRRPEAIEALVENGAGEKVEEIRKGTQQQGVSAPQTPGLKRNFGL